MKKILLIIWIIIPFFASTLFGQKLVVNETDKFTKERIKETSIEVLSMPFINALRFRMKNIDGNKYVIFKLSVHDIFSIREGDNAFLLLANNKSIKLTCNKGGIAERLSGSGNLWYGEGWFPLSEEDINDIIESPIVSVRIDTGDNYVTFNNVKEKNYKKFLKAYSLIQN